MKICPNCGKEVQDQDSFCTYCGEKLDSGKSVAEESLAKAEETAQESAAKAEETVAESTVKAEETAQESAVKAEETAQESAVKVEETVQASAGEQVESAPETFHNTVADPAEKKSGLPKLLIPIVAVVLLLCVAFFAFGKNLLLGGGNASPEQKFLNYQFDYLNGKVKSMEELGFLTEKTKEEVTMVLTGEVKGVDEINKYLKDSALTFKANSDMEKGNLQLSAGLKLMGSDVLEAYGEYMDGQVGFAIPAVDDNFYKGDYKTILKNLTGEDKDAPNLKEMKENRELGKRLVKKYSALLSTLVTKDNLTVEKKEVSLDGIQQKFKGEVYTFKPKADEIKSFLERLADMIEKDSDLEKLIEQGMFGNDLNEAMGLGQSPTAKEQLASLAKQMREEAEKNGKAIEAANFTWEIAVEGKQLREIKLSANENVFSLEVGKDGGKTIEQVNVQSESTENYYLSNTYEKKGKTLKGSISGGNGIVDITGLEYNIEIGKKSPIMPYGTYTVKDPSGMGGEATLTVKDGAKDSTDHELVLSGLSSYGSILGSVGKDLESVKINLNTTEKAEFSVPKEKVVDISDYSEDDFFELGEKIQQSLAGTFMNVLGGTQ